MIAILGLIMIIVPVLLICLISRKELKIAGLVIVFIMGLFWLYSYVNMGNCRGPDGCIFAGVFPFLLFLSFVASALTYGIRMIFTRPKD